MLDIISPIDAALLRRVKVTSPEQLTEYLTAARAAQNEWKRDSALRERAIREFRDRILRHRDDLALTLTLEMGKPITQARAEIDAFLGRIDYFLSVAPHCQQTLQVSSSETLHEEISFDPLGVIACVSAWNYPYFVGGNVFIPALLTGNCVLYKPSELATLTGLAIEQHLHAAGVPSAVFRTIVGDGRVGATLVDAQIDAVFFTGSVTSGRAISQALAGRFIPLQLELGGKDAVYVCDDVAVDDVAGAVADGAFYNNGQSCCSVERIYVHEAIYERYLARFLEVVASFVVGDPRNENTYIGPLARAPQLAFLERQIENAVSRGAAVALGGQRMGTQGNYFQPTVLTGVPRDALVTQEESFGPIVTISPVPNDAAAIELMNDSCYGLTAGVYTTSRARARQVLSSLDVGTCYWNACDRVSPRLPWSGRRDSGIGVTLGEAGIRAFLRPRAWHWVSP